MDVTEIKMTLKASEAAKLMQISTAKMYELCRRKDFPKVRVGRAIRIPVRAFEEWLNNQASEDV